ncbi:MAG: hypothetical protein KDC92_03885 [Bacteroidetes bacterium]|nr:hypothetical protein [Bacteroidota bacterium]
MKKVIIALTVLTALVSCKKDPNAEANEILEGTWTVTSLIIAGNEEFGETKRVTRASFEFKSTGETRGTYVEKNFSFGTEYTDKGEYFISEEGLKITLENDNNSIKALDATLDLTESSLKMTYKNENGKNEIVTATK